MNVFQLMTDGRRGRMKVRLKGVHTVKKRLASGKVATYHYAWAGGPRLTGEPGSDEFLDSYRNAHASEKRQYSRDTVGGLVTFFQGSNEFQSLKKSTRRDYARMLSKIADRFGTMPTAALSDPRCRKDFKDFREGFLPSAREADRAWMVLRRLFYVAKDYGLIDVNPCERGGKLYSGSRADIIWYPDDMARLETSASKWLLHPYICARDTGQRQGDILALKWSQWDGMHISIIQSKGKVPVRIMATPELRNIIEGIEKTSTHVFLNSRGKPWTSSGYQASFNKLRGKVGLKHVTFHDLRGTFITMRRREGSSVEDIASITGHSISQVRTILEQHYLAFDQAVSDRVILKMGNR